MSDLELEYNYNANVVFDDACEIIDKLKEQIAELEKENKKLKLFYPQLVRDAWKDGFDSECLSSRDESIEVTLANYEELSIDDIENEKIEALQQELKAKDKKLAALEFEKDKAYRARDCVAMQNVYLEYKNRELRARHFASFNDEECWIYQGDETDNLHSLVCPVVISARDLIALKADSKTKDEQLTAYQVAVNKIDDAFEYAYGDDKARAKIHEILAELTAKLGGTFKADSKDSEKKLKEIFNHLTELCNDTEFDDLSYWLMCQNIKTVMAEYITKED